MRRLTGDGSMKLMALAACVLLAMGLLALPACGGDESEASADQRPASARRKLRLATPRRREGHLRRGWLLCKQVTSG